MINIIYADLHTPLFMAGVNFGTKLDPTKRTSPHLKLQWDDDNRRLVVVYNGKVCFIPEANIASAQPENPKDIGVEVVGAHVPPIAGVTTAGYVPMVANVSATAQVETPMQRVQQPPKPPRIKAHE